MPNVSGGAANVGSDQITDGAIVNADINASAAIAQSKLNLSITNAEVNAAAAIADTKLAQIATAGKVSGAALTSLANIPAGAGVIPAANVPSSITIKGGVASYQGDTASGNQVIAHGLGAAPDFVVLEAKKVIDNGDNDGLALSCGTFDGTNMASASTIVNIAAGAGVQEGSSTAAVLEIWDEITKANKQVATITVDATNITLAWTKTGSPGSPNIRILWHAFT